jgi:hypothetical protein
MSLKVEGPCSDHGVLLCGRALAEREVNSSGTSLFQRTRGKWANMNEDVLKGKWNEIKGK